MRVSFHIKSLLMASAFNVAIGEYFSAGQSQRAECCHHNDRIDMKQAHKKPSAVDTIVFLFNFRCD